MKKSISLRTVFTLNFLIVIIILIVIVSTLISIRATDQYKNEIGNSLSEISYQMSDKLAHNMWSKYREVSLLSKLNELSNLDNKIENRK